MSVFFFDYVEARPTTCAGGHPTMNSFLEESELALRAHTQVVQELDTIYSVLVRVPLLSKRDLSSSTTIRTPSCAA